MHRKANPAADFYRMQSCAIPTAPAWALGLLLLKAVL